VSPTGAFLIYAAFCVVTFAIVWFLVPETKGRTLEEIEHMWLDRPRASGLSS